MLKQNKKHQVNVKAATSPSKAIRNGNEEFDIEAAKSRVLACETSVNRK